MLAWFKSLFRIGPKCEHCGSRDKVRSVSSQTMYVWDGTGKDPNRDLVLCWMCADEYTEMMNERWEEYYSSRL